MFFDASTKLGLVIIPELLEVKRVFVFKSVFGVFAVSMVSLFIKNETDKGTKPPIIPKAKILKFFIDLIFKYQLQNNRFEALFILFLLLKIVKQSAHLSGIIAVDLQYGNSF